MSPNEQHDEPADGVYTEASQWFVEIREGDLDANGQARFARWLRRSPDHIRAYMEVAALWSDIPRLTAHLEVDVEAIVAHARARQNLANIRSDATRHPTPSPGGKRRRRRLATLVAAAVLVLATVGLGTWSYTRSGHSYATGIGEDRLVNLPDGSDVQLSPRTLIRVHFTSTDRRVELANGQALFRIAGDPTRPFTVASQNTQIRAVGTQFDVQQRPSGTTVTVLEGRVAVTPAQTREPTLQPVLLTAGEQVVVPVRLGSTLVARPIDPKAATVWTERVLNFQDAPLVDVVEEFNRFNEKQMVLADSSLGSLRISGVFSAAKPGSLLRFLSDQVQLDVADSGKEIRIGSKAERKMTLR